MDNGQFNNQFGQPMPQPQQVPMQPIAQPGMPPVVPPTMPMAMPVSQPSLPLKNMDILKKTMPFVWIRFGLYFLLGIGIVIYYILVFLLLGDMIANAGGAGFIIGAIAIGLGAGIYIWALRYINWLVKAAHIAVIAELSEKGALPPNISIIKYGQEQVKRRFVATTLFWPLTALIKGATNQIQSAISAVGGLLEKLPAVGGIIRVVTGIINLFVGIVLGYVGEAVLARIFTRKDESAWKGAADGVVLYFENWKAILKNAIGLVIFVVAFYVVGTAALYGLCYGLIALLITTESVWVVIISCILGLVILSSIKASFVDSWITISVVNKYTAITANQQPKFDLYSKAKGWSKKFAQICTNAEAEGAVVGGVVPQPGGTAYGQKIAIGGLPAVNYPGQPMAQPNLVQQQTMMQQPFAQEQAQIMAQPQPMVQPIQQPAISEQPQMVVQAQPVMQQPVMATVQAPMQQVAQPQITQPQMVQPVPQPAQQPMPGVMPPQQMPGQPMVQPGMPEQYPVQPPTNIQ